MHDPICRGCAACCQFTSVEFWPEDHARVPYGARSTDFAPFLYPPGTVTLRKVDNDPAETGCDRGRPCVAQRGRVGVDGRCAWHGTKKRPRICELVAPGGWLCNECRARAGLPAVSLTVRSALYNLWWGVLEVRALDKSPLVAVRSFLRDTEHATGRLAAFGRVGRRAYNRAYRSVEWAARQVARVRGKRREEGAVRAIGAPN